MKAGYIPSEPIRSLVAEYVQERVMGDLEVPGWGHDRTYSEVHAVAQEFGVSPNSLKFFLGGFRYGETMPFELADHWLCKMDKVDLWWSELADIYYGVDLSEPDAGLVEKRRKARVRMAARRKRMTPEQIEAERARKRKFARDKYHAKARAAA